MLAAAVAASAALAAVALREPVVPGPVRRVRAQLPVVRVVPVQVQVPVPAPRPEVERVVLVHPVRAQAVPVERQPSSQWF
jgi:hypothetical protein